MKKLFLIFLLLLFTGNAWALSHEELVNKANAGDVEAQYALGSLYYWGDDIKNDAIRAQCSLGSSYFWFPGVKEDYAKAFKLLLPVAEQGHAIAQFYVGNMYLRGMGVEKDSNEGIKWLTRSAEQGYAHAQAILGLEYYMGIDVVFSYAKSIKWLSLSAAQGHPGAQYELERAENPYPRPPFPEPQSDYDIFYGQLPLTQADINAFEKYVELYASHYDELESAHPTMQDSILAELERAVGWDTFRQLYVFAKIDIIYDVLDAPEQIREVLLAHQPDSLMPSQAEFELVLNNRSHIEYLWNLMPD